VQLIAALATRADLLLLDEPTSGLDLLMEVAFRDCVKEAKERGQTVFLSSHILSEVEALCDRVGILRRGRLVDEGTLQELRHLAAQTVDVTFFDAAPSSRRAAREEELEARLQTLLSEPLGRSRWLGGRLLLAVAGAAALSLAIGLLTWAGAASQGAGVSLAQMLEAGANCMPVALLFLGLAALAYATVPRASSAIAYVLVAVAFMWDLLGSLLGVPRWLVELTPFEHVGLVPAQAFRGGAAAAMGAIGVLAALAALVLFRRRDLVEQ
jgi:hypothetical protein